MGEFILRIFITPPRGRNPDNLSGAVQVDIFLARV